MEHESNDDTSVLKQVWNMKVTMIPVVIYALRTIPKGLVKGVGGWEIRREIKTIQTTTLWR